VEKGIFQHVLDEAIYGTDGAEGAVVIIAVGRNGREGLLLGDAVTAEMETLTDGAQGEFITPVKISGDGQTVERLSVGATDAQLTGDGRLGIGADGKHRAGDDTDGVLQKKSGARLARNGRGRRDDTVGYKLWHGIPPGTF
jgi:hypothetical protein